MYDVTVVPSSLWRNQLEHVSDRRAAAAGSRAVRLRVGGLLEVELAGQQVAVAEAVPAEVGLLGDAWGQHEAGPRVEEPVEKLVVDDERTRRELGGMLCDAVLLRSAMRRCGSCRAEV